MKSRPKCLGTGLLSLDLIYQDEDYPYAAAGGSCGNVMAMLTSFGWDARPAGKIGTDSAGAILLHDLASVGVNTDFVLREKETSTPIILEFITQSIGAAGHGFSRTCHKTDKKLPRYEALSEPHARRIIDHANDFDIYYFDRLDERSLLLAKTFHKLNKPVFFEPQKVSSFELFCEVLAYTSILKVSEDALLELSVDLDEFLPELTIVTRGKKGLSYQFKDGKAESLPSMLNDNIVDACGSGDWLSASLINELFKDNTRSLREFSKPDMDNILYLSQQKSVDNLSYLGARGMMYCREEHADEPMRSFTCDNGIHLKGVYLQLQDDIPPSGLLADPTLA